MTVMKKLASGALLVALLVPLLASASIQVQGTRFIYPGNVREITVDLHNEADRAALVQSWLDSGNPSSEPGAEQLPFVVLPPLVRVEPQVGQTLRIAYTGQSLPEDRESVFWLNVLDVPPKPQANDGEEQNVMRLAFRTRVKMFFRPGGLQGSLEEAVEHMSWSLQPVGNGYALRATNDSPYHVSFRDLALTSGGHTYPSIDSGMVDPYATADFPLKGLTSAVVSGDIVGHWLNDFGASVEQNYSLMR